MSCDSVEDHLGWIEDVKGYNGLSSFDYPIIADPSRELANQFGMIDAKLGIDHAELVGELSGRIGDDRVIEGAEAVVALHVFNPA